MGSLLVAQVAWLPSRVLQGAHSPALPGEFTNSPAPTWMSSEAGEGLG